MIVSALDFLSEESFSKKFFVIFGDEPGLIFKVKKKIRSSFNNVEKIFIELEDKNFDEQLQSAVLSNSLFNDLKIIEFNCNKNKFNKGVLGNIQLAAQIETDNIIIFELPNILQKIIATDLVSNLPENFKIINCSCPNNSQISNFLRTALPKNFINQENIQLLVDMYEGNFSLLLNDIEIAIEANINEADFDAVFFSNAIKNNFKLFEEMQKGNLDTSLQIISSMEKADKGSSALLLWMFARDCRAILDIKAERNSFKQLKIWSNQENIYKSFAGSISEYGLKKLLSLLEKFDKSIKGVLDFHSWEIAREIAVEFCKKAR